MTDYTLNTKKNWMQTKIELEHEFYLWGVTDYAVSPSNQNPTSVRFSIRGKEINLTMGKQYQPKDNLRVIFFTIKTMRMNEVRGMNEIFESAYLQLASPDLVKDPWDVLGLPRGTSLPVCEAQYRELVKSAHPDAGGSDERMKDLNDAIQKIREEGKIQ